MTRILNLNSLTIDYHDVNGMAIRVAIATLSPHSTQFTNRCLSMPSVEHVLARLGQSWNISNESSKAKLQNLILQNFDMLGA